MSKIMGGSAKGKVINCVCNICEKKHSIVGENYYKHDELYYEMKKKGIAKAYCKECLDLLEDSDVLGWDEY